MGSDAGRNGSKVKMQRFQGSQFCVQGSQFYVHTTIPGRWWTEGRGPACVNGELYGFSQPLLQLIRPLIETPVGLGLVVWNVLSIWKQRAL